MNTILISVIATLMITGIMSTCYSWGKADGKKEADMRNIRIIVSKIQQHLEDDGDMFIEFVCQRKRHEGTITYADLEAFEQEQYNKPKEQVK